MFASNRRNSPSPLNWTLSIYCQYVMGMGGGGGGGTIICNGGGEQSLAQ